MGALMYFSYHRGGYYNVPLCASCMVAMISWCDTKRRVSA